MFRISFSFSRLFRLRGRRTARAGANLRRTPSAPAPFRSSQPVPALAQVGSVDVPPAPSPSSARKRPRSLLINPFSGLSSISRSPSTPPPSDATIQNALAPTIVIGRDTAQQTPTPLPPVSAPSGHVGPQIPTDGVSLLQPTSTQANPRVSFQLPTWTDDSDRPETPLSTSSTLISEIEARRDGETVIDDRMGSTSVVPSIDREQIFAPNEEAVPPDGVASAGSTSRSNASIARHASLISPQPVQPDGVRVNRSRFSLPALSRTQTSHGDVVTGDDRRENRRRSLLSFASSSRRTPTTVKKEGRMERFSRELSKPETQEVLRTLAWRI